MKREKMEYKLKKALDHQRYEHTLGVEETARMMARAFGEDEERAALAGLLHDCAKCMPLSQMIKAAKHAKTDDVMKESKALMHAVAGMCIARDVYDVKDEAVLQAIRWHTTGRANMTNLEKIIYLADYMEPTRSFRDLTEVRRLAMEDLDRACLMSFTMSVEHLEEKGYMVHPNSVYARDYLKGLLS